MLQRAGAHSARPPTPHEQERTLTRIRDATGREDADEILKNMTQEEADRCVPAGLLGLVGDGGARRRGVGTAGAPAASLPLPPSLPPSPVHAPTPHTRPLMRPHRFDEEWVAEAEQQLLRNPGTTARLGAGAGRRAAAAAASRPPLMLQQQQQQQLGTGGSRGAGQYQQQAAQPGGGYSYAGSYANGTGHTHRAYGPGARSYSSTMHH